MTDTRFTAGAATAYVTADVLALTNGTVVDPDVMAWCAAGAGWDTLVAATAGLSDTVVVHHDVDRLHVAVAGSVRAIVETADGEQHLVGEPSRTVRSIERPLAVRLVAADAATDAATRHGPVYRVDGGAVPASTVHRRFASSEPEAMDVFDALFGRTVPRTVEHAAVREADDHARRAPLGILVFSTGTRVVLDRSMVLGRNPGRTESRVAGGPPRLVRVATSGVSRCHAAITVERWRASIEDLGSSNGTVVTLPGHPSSRLEVGHPVDLVPGAVVELGGDVSFVVEGAT